MCRSDYHDPQKPQCSYNDTKYFLHQLLLSLFALAQPEEGQLVNSQYGLPHAQQGERETGAPGVLQASPFPREQ